MTDYNALSPEAAADAYCEDCGRAQEEMEAAENEVYYHCQSCSVCGEKILPHEAALTIDGGNHYFHERHLEETTGEELAIKDGCDYDAMARYRESTE